MLMKLDNYQLLVSGYAQEWFIDVIQSPPTEEVSLVGYKLFHCLNIVNTRILEKVLSPVESSSVPIARSINDQLR